MEKILQVKYIFADLQSLLDELNNLDSSLKLSAVKIKNQVILKDKKGILFKVPFTLEDINNIFYYFRGFFRGICDKNNNT